MEILETNGWALCVGQLGNTLRSHLFSDQKCKLMFLLLIRRVADQSSISFDILVANKNVEVFGCGSYCGLILIKTQFSAGGYGHLASGCMGTATRPTCETLKGCKLKISKAKDEENDDPVPRKLGTNVVSPHFYMGTED
jgi:hypothetical protein